MKKVITVVSALALTLGLSSCATSPSDVNFDKKIINTTPHWDINNMKLGSWEDVNATSNPQPTQTAALIKDKVVTEPTQPSNGLATQQQSSLKETSSYTFARLINSKSKCMIEGRIMYQESYKQNRGDLFNSKNYLYSLVPSSENPVTHETTEQIDGNSYIVGEYTLPKALGENVYHKTAVRTFSTPVKILGGSGFSKDELGNYNSDLTLGLPTVIIDMSCPQPDELNSGLWTEGVNKFKLLFDAIPMPEKTQ